MIAYANRGREALQSDTHATLDWPVLVNHIQTSIGIGFFFLFPLPVHTRVQVLETLFTSTGSCLSSLGVQSDGSGGGACPTQDLPFFTSPFFVGRSMTNLRMFLCGFISFFTLEGFSRAMAVLLTWHQRGQMREVRGSSAVVYLLVCQPYLDQFVSNMEDLICWPSWRDF